VVIDVKHTKGDVVCRCNFEKGGLGRLGLIGRVMDTEDQRKSGKREHESRQKNVEEQRKEDEEKFDSGNGMNSQIFRRSSVEAILLPFQQQVRPHPRPTIWFVVPTYDWSQFLFDQPPAP